MDSLTHLAAGALTPIAFRGSPRRAAVIVFGIAAGELPDLDVLFGTGAKALLTLHRGISHALVWQPVLALALVMPFYIWLRCREPRGLSRCGPGGYDPAGCGSSRCGPGGGVGFGRMWLAALFALCTHIYLDCMTTFGTMALLPFSPARIGFPAMFIVDFLLTLPLLALLVLALREPGGPDGYFSGRARRFALAGLAWALLYPLLAYGVNQIATARYAAQLESASWFAPETAAAAEPGAAPEEGPRFGRARLVLLTEPFSPLAWKAVIDQGSYWRMDVLSLCERLAPLSVASGRLDTTGAEPGREAGPGAPLFDAVYAKPEPLLYEGLKRQLPLFVWFEDFAPYMVQEERPVPPLVQAGYRETIREYAFADLRYIMPERSFAHRVGQGAPHFVLEARVNDSGALVAWRFLENGRDAVAWTLVE